MRRMSADNHRGQEVKIFRQQAGYMRAMINSHITDRCLAKRRGPYRYFISSHLLSSETSPTSMLFYQTS